MRKKKFLKRLAAFGIAAALVASGPVAQVVATQNTSPGGNTLPKTLELVKVDQNHASGGITPTVFHDSYVNPKEIQYRSRTTDTIPAKFDLREKGNSTTVKNQVPWGSCWAFAALSSLESSQLSENDSGMGAETDPDYSELQLAWFAYEPQTKESLKVSAADSDQVGEGTTSQVEKRLDKGGNMPQVAALLSTWQGAALETEIPYQNTEGNKNENGTWEVEPAKRNLSSVHLQNADFLGSPATFSKHDPSADADYIYDAAATKTIKKALMNHGAVAIGYFADQSEPDGDQNGDYFNYTNYCQYVNTQKTINHAVSIVGWDDSYPKENFKEAIQPPADGAWLVKNSWGSNWGTTGTEGSNGNKGYFWLSYYDQTIDQVTSFQGESTNNYDNIYQYDYLGLASGMEYNASDREISIANVFTASDNEEIQAVSAVTQAPNSTVSIQIYKVSEDATGPIPENTDPMAEQSAVIDHSGYHTIKLNTPAAITKGDKFSVVQTIKGYDNKWYIPVEISANHSDQKAVCNSGESYMIEDGIADDLTKYTYPDVTIGNAMIKVFTNDVVPESEAPTLRSFDYEAYDKENVKIETKTVEAGNTNTKVELPAGTSYIKITNPALSDAVEAGKQLTVKVNGVPYTLGDPIQRADLVKENDEIAVVMTTSSSPKGTNTNTYNFSFTCTPLVKNADGGKVVVTDANGYLPTSVTLTADKVVSGGTFDAIKQALTPVGGADTFYIYNLTLTPALGEKESVNLAITADDNYPATDKTVLYYFDDSTNVLSEVTNGSDGRTLCADVSQMGYYVIAQVKDKPAVPVLDPVTYSPNKTLADVSIPAVAGGTWAWDDPSVIPEVKTGTYKATFTPGVDSPYRTYHADIELTVNKATPVQASSDIGTAIVYGQTLADSTLNLSFKVDDTVLAGRVSWKDGNIIPKVSDSNKTEYEIIFQPADTDNYTLGSGSAKVKIGKKKIEVTINDAAKTYGDDNPEFSVRIPSEALVGDDTIEDLAIVYECTADKKTSVATKTAINGTSNAVNYDVKVNAGTLTIHERPIHIKAKDVSINYGAPLPSKYDVEITNLISGDENNLGLTTEIQPLNVPNGNLAGSYTLKIKGAKVTSKNYKIGNLTDGTLTIRETIIKRVSNNSSTPLPGFGASGNILSDEVLKIEDLASDEIIKIFADLVGTDQILGATYDISLKKADGQTDQPLTGRLTLTIPVDKKYNGKKLTVLHYVKAGELNAENIPVDMDTIDRYSGLTVKDSKIQVDVYSLSPFAVILPKVAEAGGTGPASDDGGDRPKVTSQEVASAATGDTTSITGLLFAASAAAVIIIGLAIGMVRRRRKS